MRTCRYALVLTALGFSVFAPSAVAGPATAIERLGLDSAQSSAGPTGENVQIVILSEAVHIDHPHLHQRAIGQWHIRFAEDGQPNAPELAEPTLSASDWHGTHIAGIVGADCALDRFRGVACAADLSVHDFGTYGDFPYFDEDREAGLSPETAFFRRVSASMKTVVGSDIANLSFNIEAPYIPVDTISSSARVIESILAETAGPFDDMFTALPGLIADGKIALTNRHDASYLEYVGARHNDPPILLYGPLLPLSDEWHDMALAFGAFQNAGGVVVISESNNRFEGRSGVLNAMPSLSQDVSSDDWMSVVYVRLDGAGGYEAPLNGCGRLAATYCIAVRADDVLASVPGDELVRAESGHSMAAPMLSGVLALLVEKGRREDPNFRASQALTIVRDSARRDFDGYSPLIHGVGLLDASAALAALDTDRKP